MSPLSRPNPRFGILALGLLGALTLGACNLPYSASEATSEAALELRLEHGTSFGMCIGYCYTTLLVDEDSTVLVLEGRGRGGDDVPTRRFARPTSPEVWAELEALAGDAPLDELPETMGCPDCADGGAEWIAVDTPADTDRVTFEYGATVEEIARLQALLRAERATFDAQVEAAHEAIAPGR